MLCELWTEPDVDDVHFCVMIYMKRTNTDKNEWVLLS